MDWAKCLRLQENRLIEVEQGSASPYPPVCVFASRVCIHTDEQASAFWHLYRFHPCDASCLAVLLHLGSLICTLFSLACVLFMPLCLTVDLANNSLYSHSLVGLSHCFRPAFEESELLPHRALSEAKSVLAVLASWLAGISIQSIVPSFVLSLSWAGHQPHRL